MPAVFFISAGRSFLLFRHFERCGATGFPGMLTANPEGSIWICRTPSCNSGGCTGGGIFEHGNGGLQSAIPPAPLRSELSSLNAFVADLKGNAWIGTRKELMKIGVNSTDRYLTGNDTIPEWEVSALAFAFNDDMLICEKKYPDSGKAFLYNLHNDPWLPLDSVTHTLVGRSVAAACADRDGSFWAGASDEGLYRCDADEEMFFEYMSPSPFVAM